MEQLTFFQRHLPSTEERVVVRDPAREHLVFADVALEVIGGVAARWGFERRLTQVEGDQTTLVFVKDSQKIELRASTDHREGPAYFNLILWAMVDEGGTDLWTNVALWHLQRVIEGDAKGREYAFPYDGEVEVSLERAAIDLERFGATFLLGDLALFETARSRKWVE